MSSGRDNLAGAGSVPPSVMATSTVENYLKQIYLAQQEGVKGELVAMGSLAAAVGVTAGTATSMVKTLADSNLLEYEPRGGVRLTAAGERVARQVLRRHRLIEQFLVEIVGLDWSEVHVEAEELEHAVSDKLLERLDALLGHPETDPHGDPIPPAEHVGARRATPKPAWSLYNCPVDRLLRVARVLDQTPPFLQFLDRHGLVPGAAISVTDRQLAGDAVTVRLDGSDTFVTLGSSAAAKLLVHDDPATGKTTADKAPAGASEG